MNGLAPEETQVLVQTADGVAPISNVAVTRVAPDVSDYRVEWTVNEDQLGSGFRHVTLYVAQDGGDFKIWQGQVAEPSGTLVFEGESGHSYEFLALATDVAGNREQAVLGRAVADDGSRVNLGSLPTLPSTTPPDFGIAPQPSDDPSASALFIEAQQQTPAAQLPSRAAEFDQTVRPFVAYSFANGIGQSHANIGPMAIAETPDGDVLISGGGNRGAIYQFGHEGGTANAPLSQLSDPIFNFAFDSSGRLWATTGGGPLLQLEPSTGEVLNRYGDGLTVALAIHPVTGQVFVGSNGGVEIFNPEAETFSHFSRDLDLRVSSLAFDNDAVALGGDLARSASGGEVHSDGLRRDDAGVRERD